VVVVVVVPEVEEVTEMFKVVKICVVFCRILETFTMLKVADIVKLLIVVVLLLFKFEPFGLGISKKFNQT
jgi:hypothetical protein